ncbi:hypothetical protein P175DRAFT_0560948 [Aspergillus ochraceoroseus IBT 24754]|uniref:WSC domain-containing protein n=2 Tax=Aspergillus ochraceoroseus TaxID=138278 RepID=A0A2T5LLV7_9EURO|nr:uncharacterized protein P175DRAFT_0560948 [Aspergillus ochraceoroseus IBT 24754]KKK19766.1 hypothetical protein AOCH_003191 [Aspergillus ochraceoroseus]PTU17264.1 hypothetical protein P175DRAFT_0560948 [Aspergillus ochraceoroseus IBT 24754]
MRAAIFTSLACIAASAAAFQYPEFVPLHRRQDPGTPEYNCHANCGGVIVAARTDGYCGSSQFKSELSECLDCALEYDIWKYYGSSVSAAATNCGLDATPVESASSTTTGTGTSTTTETTTTTSSKVESTTTSEETTTTSSATPPASVSSSSTVVSSSSLIPTASPTASGSPTSSPSTPSPSTLAFEGGASTLSRGGLLFGIIAGSIIAALCEVPSMLW